jgi:transposase-like protein
MVLETREVKLEKKMPECPRCHLKQTVVLRARMGDRRVIYHCSGCVWDFEDWDPEPAAA